MVEVISVGPYGEIRCAPVTSVVYGDEKYRGLMNLMVSVGGNLRYDLRS